MSPPHPQWSRFGVFLGPAPTREQRGFSVLLVWTLLVLG